MINADAVQMAMGVPVEHARVSILKHTRVFDANARQRGDVEKPAVI